MKSSTICTHKKIDALKLFNIDNDDHFLPCTHPCYYQLFRLFIPPLFGYLLNFDGPRVFPLVCERDNCIKSSGTA
uniref:Uncharacterized protein n=1 Tax=Arion vulgaris TaxID=1028688 RepID=A0A0B7BGF4_9EUPU